MNNLKIGWSSRDISTEAPVELRGQFYKRVSKGIMDPISVSALAIDNGADIVIFLSADLANAYGNLFELIRERVTQLKPEIPVLKIMMNVTHTHTAPQHNAVDSISTEYRDFLVKQASDAIIEAYEKRTEGGIAYGYGYAVVAHQRRVVYFDDFSKRPTTFANATHSVHGHGVMYGNTNDDNFSHYETGADHFVNLMYTFDSAGKLTGAIINVPCPSQNSESGLMISADYWHDVRVAIKEKFGDIFILPQCAAAGDLSPRILHYKKAEERRFKLKYGEEGTKDLFERRDIAQRIAQSFSEVYEWASKDIKTSLPLTHIVDTIYLSKRVITDEEYLKAKQHLDSLSNNGEATEKEIAPGNKSKLEAAKRRSASVVERYEIQQTDNKMPMELHVLRIGDIAFASNRFELFMDYQHRMQARSPFEQTFIVQLSASPEGSGSYLPTKRGFMNKGYGASMYCNKVSPEGGQELVEETVKRLKSIYTE